ncbi:MAG: RluA family pseudouridine synthase [Clostridia bacterium]|nr:RluA family pseudouridine synthase [Clostridia bacterium]
MILEYLVLPSDDGKRAVDILCSSTGMSRLLAKKVRLYGSLLVDGVPARMIDPVRAGQTIRATFGKESNGCRLLPVDGVEVLYADDWIVVVHKPPGMVTHPTYLHGTDGLTTRLSPDPLHPVNRLDRDTSGLVVLAVNGHAHHVLIRSAMEKRYIGIVHGVFDPPAGRIDAPIGRFPDSIMERIVVSSGSGQEAATRYETVRILAGGCSVVRFRLETGRTHQIRVHCRHAGHALVGDSLYPDRKGHDGRWNPDWLDRTIGRQALHASETILIHPRTRQEMSFYAGLPEDMTRLIRLADLPPASV